MLASMHNIMATMLQDMLPRLVQALPMGQQAAPLMEAFVLPEQRQLAAIGQAAPYPEGFEQEQADRKSDRWWGVETQGWQGDCAVFWDQYPGAVRPLAPTELSPWATSGQSGCFTQEVWAAKYDLCGSAVGVTSRAPGALALGRVEVTDRVESIDRAKSHERDI